MRRSSSIFKEDQIFIEEENNSSDKVDMVEEEQDGIGNLVDLPKIMFINEECGNLKVMSERKVQKFYKPIDINSVTNAIDKIEVSMIFLAVTFYLGRL